MKPNPKTNTNAKSLTI